MKFYRVYSEYDAADSDGLYATKKEAMARKASLEKDEYYKGAEVIVDVIEVERLTKAEVCRIYKMAMR